MNTTIAIQVLPRVDNDAEVVRIVDKVIEYIASTGINYDVGPLETVLEGDYEKLMEVIRVSNEIAIKEGAPSVSTYVKIIYSPKGKVLSIEEKTGKYRK